MAKHDTFYSKVSEGTNKNLPAIQEHAGTTFSPVGLHQPREPQCTASQRQTDRQTDGRTDDMNDDAHSHHTARDRLKSKKFDQNISNYRTPQ